jgi:hypothetical protein
VVPTHQQPQPPQFIEQPPSLPFSGHDSSDAIALRAAISSLQFQRLQAQRDLRTLEDIKRQAIERPEEYRKHVIATAQAKPQPPPWAVDDSPDQDMDSDDDAVLGASATKGQEPIDAQSESIAKSYPTSYGSMLQSRPAKKPPQPTGFPAVPLPQDVVRCPPIEWAKYNIVGESLDKLHRDQQAHPGEAGSSQRDSVVAAPYNPFLDKLDPRPVLEATSSTRKDSGSSASEQHAQRRPSKPAMWSISTDPLISRYQTWTTRHESRVRIIYYETPKTNKSINFSVSENTNSILLMIRQQSVNINQAPTATYKAGILY